LKVLTKVEKGSNQQILENELPKKFQVCRTIYSISQDTSSNQLKGR